MDLTSNLDNAFLTLIQCQIVWYYFHQINVKYVRQDIFRILHMDVHRFQDLLVMYQIVSNVMKIINVENV